MAAVAVFVLAASRGESYVQVGANVPATAMNLARRVASNSPQLAVDPTEARFVVMANRLDGPDFSCSLQISGDRGRHWLTDNPVPALPPGAEKCYAPEVAFDRDGILYYLFVGLAGKGNSPMGAFLTTSTDGGRVFSRPRQILGGDRYMVRMALDPELGPRGRLHLVWLQTGSSAGGGLPPSANPIMASFSDDGGTTFSAPQQVSDGARARVVAPAVAIGPDHSLQVLYYDLGQDARDYEGLEGPRWEEDWALVLSASHDAGGHFDRSSVVDSQVTPPERVMLIYTMPPASMVMDQQGRIFVAWHDARNGDWDVFLRRSTDGGRSWAPALRLNDDPVHDGRHQYLPRLSVSPGGRIDAIFYDRRGNVENRGNDVYYTYSLDGGASFSRNLKLTSLDSDSLVGPRYGVVSARGLVELGSRMALVSGDSWVLGAWADTRNDARGITAQDIFATEVAFPDGPERFGWLVALGSALVLLGTCVVAFSVMRGRRSGGKVRRGRSGPA